jgi:AcrR family transcriptional regulator
VSVAEIAREADVSEKTVFNYFPTKEDLVYWRLSTFEDELLDAVRERADGESVLDAFGRFVRAPRGLLGSGDEAARERLAALSRMIASSPALLAREQQIFARYTDSLAALVAAETGAVGIEPWVVANAMMGVHRGLVSFTRERIVAGETSPRLARAVRDEADRALERLAAGLGGYGVKEP